MAEGVGGDRSVVMLTADRQIDRRILLGMDSLEAAGWSVTTIAMPVENKADDDHRVVRIGSGDFAAGRETLVLDAYRWVRGHLPMNGHAMRLMKRLAWRYLVDQESFYTRLFYGTASRYAPRVFVANDLPMLPVAKRLALERGARLVYDSHELYSEQEFSPWEKRRWSEIEARHIGACDAVITVNPSIASELERRYGIDHVNVILNADRCGAHLQRTRVLHRKFGLADDRQVLLLQGGLSAGRNLEVLVDAMAHVRNASVVLVVLGDGLLLDRLRARAAPMASSGRVYFHPAVPQRDLPAFTAAADAGIIPYQATCLNNFYCTPNKLFEFIAAGIPVLASDLPEISRLVRGNDIGLVGDMGSAGKIAALIDDFFGDPQRLAAWRDNLSTVRADICWETEERKLVKIYQALR